MKSQIKPLAVTTWIHFMRDRESRRRFTQQKHKNVFMKTAELKWTRKTTPISDKKKSRRKYCIPTFHQNNSIEILCGLSTLWSLSIFLTNKQCINVMLIRLMCIYIYSQVYGWMEWHFINDTITVSHVSLFFINIERKT